MKKARFFSLAAVVLAASTGHTQGSTAGSQSSSSGSTLKLSKPAKKLTDGQSTASLSTVAPTSGRKYHVTLMNQTSAGKVALEKGEAKTSGFNRFQVTYDLTANSSLIFREDAPVSFDSKSKQTEFHVADPFLGYTNTKFATLPFGWVVTVQPRLYLPLGEKSRFVTKALGSEALLVAADKSIGKFDFEVAGFFQYHNNVQDYSWAAEASDTSFKAVANPDWMSFIEGEVAYNLTPELALIHDVYLVTEQARSTPVLNAIQRNTFMNETILSYQPLKAFKIQASIENDAVLDSQNSVQLYKDDDITYNLYVKLTL